MTFTIGHYQVIKKLYESLNSVVYRAIRQSDKQSVILKVLKQNWMNSKASLHYNQEYAITRSLGAAEGVIRVYGEEVFEQKKVLILEDFGAISLKQWCNARTPNLQEFLSVAIKISETLGHVHEHQVIHKDINPANILIHPETGLIKIIDFGIATQLSRENPSLKNPDVLEGTLAYLSPEQTGRMNRVLDYRTDFYSLGITFYELLTGELPFENYDPLDLVHCHIAKQPKLVHEINSEIPEIISEIILKLMAKAAEDRYQSAFGLAQDLQACLEQLEQTGQITHFALGAQDHSDRFQIPQKLYGREAQIQELLEAFDRVSQGTTELMLIAGYSGIGKSSLVAEVYKPMTKARGYFIAGKFEQFQRNTPYVAIIRAFQSLVQQLLTENEEKLHQWRQKLQSALGANGHVIIDVIPEIELVIGPQPPVPDLGPIESQNRFNLVFQNFIGAFCSSEHPLVIFLDDLQWSDSASFKLVELVLVSEIKHLFLIGAYRDNEVDISHPLMLMIEALKKKDIAINLVTLNSLSLDYVKQLIAETIYADLNTVEPLAELVIRMTGGNPFFINELLKTLYAEDLLKFNAKNQQWSWDLIQIQGLGLMDNVVELVMRKVQQLPTLIQKTLALAACIGTEFSLDCLVFLQRRSPIEIFEDLKVTIELGLILPISELDNQLLIQNYRFGHDRIQQAVDALLNLDQKKVIHFHLGQDLFNKTAPDALPEKAIAIVKHLNLCLDLIEDPAERQNLAWLNLMAGRKAKLSAAYESALNYLTIGIELVGQIGWQNCYNLTLQLYLEKIQLTYLTGDYIQHNQLADIALQSAETRLDQSKIYNIKLQALKSQHLHQETVDLGLEVLKLLGVVFTSEKDPIHLQQELAAIQFTLKGRHIQDLVDLPLMQDPEKEAAVEIMAELLPSVYHCDPAFFPFFVFKQIDLAFQAGHVPDHTQAYVCYGMVLCGMGDIEGGYQAGQLALKLVDKLHAIQLKPIIIFLVSYFCNAWKMHPRETLPPIRESYLGCLDVGDLEKACFSIQRYCLYHYFSGLSCLTDLEKEIASYCHAIAKLNQAGVFKMHNLYHQVVLNLMDLNEDPCCLNGQSLNRDELMEKSHIEITLFHLYLNEAILCYLFYDYAKAASLIAQTEVYLNFLSSSPVIPILYFYKCLIGLKTYGLTQDPDLKEQTLSAVNEDQIRIKNWASYAPTNLQHKYDLIEAEKLYALGQYWEAAQCYQQAIQGAENNEYLQEEALAYALAAEFYYSRNLDPIANLHIEQAYNCYVRWQAWAKVADLEARYPQLLVKASLATTTHNRAITSITTSNRSKETLDLATVMKASQAIAREISLDRLLASLMKILIQNAGAQLGYLALKTDNTFYIEAFGEAESETITVLQSIPLDDYLPIGIVNYVTRTQESIVLEDASHSDNFTQDPYIIANNTKSILCTPLINQGQLIGIVYLENNLATGAFTSERLEIVQLLSGQVTISLENARLYSSLEQKVKDRTQKLSKALVELQAAQQELIQSERMAALGQLIAGIAHEINTPLGAIRSSVQYITGFVEDKFQALPVFFRSLLQEQEQIFLFLLQNSIHHNAIPLSGRERRQVRKSLIQQLAAYQIENTETLANLLLDVGVHDHLEPLLPILKIPDSENFLKTARHMIHVQESARDITIASDRAAKVVFALKTYARHDQSGKLVKANITEGIEMTLTLYYNRTKHGVDVVRHYQDVPAINCYIDELNQVWTNLIHNALQAMDYKGTLTIEVMYQEETIQIAIIDTGTGVPETIQDKIFDPFFTTKPPGEGSGLGLDIVKKIIDKHQGTIQFQSRPGQTTFTVTLPTNLEQT
jgi:predicted ATPase/signal transduction histidine kinase